LHACAPLVRFTRFLIQAGSLVTRQVLVADATFKRPKDIYR
jgi:hypothetical protein